jgi:aspartyl-tRNA(Asn)/glutamyl-tRNA(Gln) amidotransferase subunit A
MSSEAAAHHAVWLRERPTDYGPDVLQRIRGGLLTSATEYLHSQQMRTLIQEDFRAAFERVDVVVGPTVPLVAPRIGQTQQPGGPFNVVPRAIANRTSVPCGFASGLPVGLQIMGPAFDEPLVLRVAATYEAASEWRAQRPPLLATGRSS